ncbi:MAG: CPBP family intramembrane glutamic endopeptidase [Saprospiraceae bacterium]|nr:CPBP family intramembrane glutamic endopeptidase [Saprospiraceae bacterium]
MNEFSNPNSDNAQPSPLENAHCNASNIDETPPQYMGSETSPFSVIVMCFGFFIVGNLVAGGIAIGASKLYGFDFTTLLASLNEKSPLADRNFMRLTLFLNHLFGFIISAILTALYVYKNRAIEYFKLTKLPDFTSAGLSFLLLAVSIPLVQYVYWVNKMLPLPKWMLALEQDTSKTLEAVLTKEYWYEAVINVLLIGVVPAIGEELVFRGILQQQLGRIFKNEHVMVWLSAAIFSGIHMQFEGFLGRMILGALLAYSFVWTRNLWVPMIVHLLNNGLQVIAIYAANIKPSEMDKIGGDEKMTWWMALISLALVVSVAGLLKEKQKNRLSV